MEIQLICIGKTDNNDLQKLILNYQDRLKHYIKFTLQIIPDINGAKNLSQEQQKNKEAELIERQIKSSDLVVLLDEHGKEYSSVDFSEFLNKKMNSGSKRLIFIIGGYGDVAPVRLQSNGISAFVSITRGCDNMCTFCVVPFTRGRERSRDPKSILEEVDDLAAKGYKEITLLGQNVDKLWKEESLGKKIKQYLMLSM